MSLTLEALRELVSLGLTPEQILRVAEAQSIEPKRTSNAERQARFRERQRKSVTNNVTDNVTPPSPDKENAPHTPQKKLTPSPKENPPYGGQKKRASRIPDDWKPDFAQAAEIGLSKAQASAEADKFRDYWRGKPGANATKADWPATWRNWCRTAVERLPQARGSPPIPKQDSTITAIDRRIQELTNGQSAGGDFGPDAGHDDSISATFRRLTG